MYHLTDEQEKEILDYLKRHLRLFRDPDFIQLVRAGDIVTAIAYAEDNSVAARIADCGHVMFEADALRYGAFLSWLNRKLAYAPVM